MRLSEHKDFRTLLGITARNRNVPDVWVEKDYFLTEVLRIIAQELPTQAFLKGGTSLTKGWSLLQRISEDIDLVLVKSAFEPPLNGRGVNKTLLTLATTVANHPSLTWDKPRTHEVGGKARHDYFDYQSAMAENVLGVAQTVLLEAGVRSGTWPLEQRRLSSMVGDTARDQGLGDVADDASVFEMLVLDFRRTFVEKLMAVHSLVAKFVAGGSPLGRQARHYADLYVLGRQEEVVQLLGTTEFENMRSEHDALSKEFFPNNYEKAPKSFADSPSLFPDEELRRTLATQYKTDVAPLFFNGAMPTFDDVLDLFQRLRPRI